MRLRRKITVAFFGVSSLVSVLLALFLYRFLESKLGEDLHERLDNVAHVGSHAIDLTAYRALIAEGIPAERVHTTGNTVVDAFRWASNKLDALGHRCSIGGKLLKLRRPLGGGERRHGGGRREGGAGGGDIRLCRWW